MATQSWSSILDHGSDAGFRAWVADYIAHLILIGMVQTADTGQIDTATVARPIVVNAVGGYAMFRFNDALQATAPIFVKISFGTGDTAPYIPTAWVQIGTGTNGAGTLTGTVTPQHNAGQAGTGGTAGSYGIAYPSYFCHTEGFLGCAFKVGQQVVSTGCITISRYSDDSGVPTGDGFVVRSLSAPTNNALLAHAIVQSVRTASPSQVFTSSNAGTYGMWPHNTTASSATDTGDLQTVPFWYPTKKFQQDFATCGYLDGELSQGTPVVMTVKGTTPRTFIATGAAFGYGGVGANDSRIAMLWE